MKTAADHLTGAQLQFNIYLILAPTVDNDDITAPTRRTLKHNLLDRAPPFEKFDDKAPSAIGRKRFTSIGPADLERRPMGRSRGAESRRARTPRTGQRNELPSDII